MGPPALTSRLREGACSVTYVTLNMPKRSRVPAALHSELSEYSSLLRALRTSTALDLTTQLARASSSELDHSDKHSEGDATLFTAGEWWNDDERQPHLSKDATNKRSGGLTARWPLLAGDVATPEWGIEDEIQLIAQKAQSACRTYSTGEMPTNVEDISDEDLPAPCLRALTLLSVHHLSQILMLLAFHVPLVEKVSYNRMRPMDWQDILNIIASNRQIDPEYVILIRS